MSLSRGTGDEMKTRWSWDEMGAMEELMMTLNRFKLIGWEEMWDAIEYKQCRMFDEDEDTNVE